MPSEWTLKSSACARRSIDLTVVRRIRRSIGWRCWRCSQGKKSREDKGPIGETRALKSLHSSGIRQNHRESGPGILGLGRNRFSVGRKDGSDSSQRVRRVGHGSLTATRDTLSPRTRGTQGLLTSEWIPRILAKRFRRRARCSFDNSPGRGPNGDKARVRAVIEPQGGGICPSDHGAGRSSPTLNKERNDRRR
jgi:hypothetical protein